MKIDVSGAIETGDLVYSKVDNKYGMIFKVYNCSGAKYILFDLESGEELDSDFTVESIINNVDLKLVAKSSQLLLSIEN